MKYIFLILISMCANNLLAQIVIIKDSLLNTPIENVTFYFNELGITSAQNGAADLSLFSNDDTLEISHVAYHNKKILKKNIGSIVYLKQKAITLPTVFLSEFVKTPISKKYPTFTITPKGVNKLESSISGLLSSNSSISVQEGQAGGGSPNYRGMEANRLLIIVDGFPLNNAIYRSGHLQSTATINPFFIESVNLLSGPASVGYGNGAMGGALIFNTKKPVYKKRMIFSQQFESSSSSTITCFQANYHTNRTSHITAFSLNSAGNLKMGANRFHGYSDWGKEATNQNYQLYTSYAKVDFMHKTNYRINNKHNILLNTQYSRSSNIYRFDKMNDLKDGAYKYEHWYYGPQIRFFQSINHTSKYKTFLFDKVKTMLAFQDIQESRHTQLAQELLLNNRLENVKIYDLNIDLSKQIKTTQFTYGIGLRTQKVYSNANLSYNNYTIYNNTRYPDGGSSIEDIFAYSQANFPLNKKIDVVLGFRCNSSKLQAKYNPLTINFQDVQNNNLSWVKSALISFAPITNITISAAYYGGFRNPNIDDVGKVFSKDDINVVIPNANLKSEYAENAEVSFDYNLGDFKIQIQIFNTRISNAITRSYGSLNGSDSIIYDGQIMRIQMNKNIESATINGAALTADFIINDKFSVVTSFNYLNGQTNDGEATAHIPPCNAKLSFKYQLKQHIFNFYTYYNAWKLAEDYDDAGVDNLSEATLDGNPSWYTLNLAYTKKIDKNMVFSFAIKNILDSHYKTFGSGLSASGRNFVLSIDSFF